MDLKRYNFAIVIAIFAVLMTGVMLTAIVSFSSMIRISQRVGSDAVSQQQLFLLGSLMGEIQQAENSIWGYRLTHDPARMESFYANSEACTRHLTGLIELSAGDEAKLNQLYILSLLIQQKLEILEDLSQLADRSSVVSELQRISSRLDQQAAIESVEGKPRGFIRNLFSKEKQSDARLDSLHAHMLVEIGQTKRAQSSRLKRIDAVEFKYLETIHEIGHKIESLIAGLRFDSLNMVAEAVAEKEKQQIASNRKIVLFSAAAGLFLILGGMAGWSYAQTANNTKKPCNRQSTMLNCMWECRNALLQT